MNAQSHDFELNLEGNEVEEALRAIFHTVLVHRVYPKICIKGSDVWSFGSIGFNDVDCDFLDLTYVHVTCDEITRRVDEPIHAFVEQLRSLEAQESGVELWGCLNLEFFEQKRARWLFSGDCVPWELWSVKVNVVRLVTERERQTHKANVSQLVADKVLEVCEVMNRPEAYHPKLGKTADFEVVLDMNQPLCTPHHFRIFAQNSADQVNTGMSTAMKRMLKDTLNLTTQ